MIEIFISSFSLVFLRAMQQQHVIGGHYFAAALTPYAIATAEVASVLLVVRTGWDAIPVVGLGGSIGVCLAMYVYRRKKNGQKEATTLKS